MPRYSKRKPRRSGRKKKAISKRWTRKPKAKRTRRPKRGRAKRATPSTSVSGWDWGVPSRVAQVFTSNTPDGNSIWWDSLGFDTPPISCIAFSDKPSITDCVQLSERRLICREFRIKKVDWHFYKDALPSSNGFVGAAHYIGSYDRLHSKAIKNAQMRPVYGSATVTDPAQQKYIVGQAGRLLPTLTGHKKTISMPARVLQSRSYQTSYNDTSSKVELSVNRFPWIRGDTDLDNMPAISNINFYLPVITITPLLNWSPAGGLDSTNSDDRKTLSDKFQWMVRPKIHWETRGRWIDPLLVTEGVVQMDEVRADEIKLEEEEFEAFRAEMDAEDGQEHTDTDSDEEARETDRESFLFMKSQERPRICGYNCKAYCHPDEPECTTKDLTA